jgi:hypothetical protein
MTVHLDATFQCSDEVTANKVKQIIDSLKTLDPISANSVDGETMQYILKQVGMDDQMHRQLVMSFDTKETLELLEEKKQINQ